MDLSLKAVKKAIVNRPSALLALAQANGRLKGSDVSERNGVVMVRRGGRQINIDAGHLVYVFDLIKHFDDCFIDVAAERVDGIETIDFSKPKLHLVPWLHAEIFYNSIAEEKKDVDSYMQRLAPKQGDVILDLGAYCGATACAFSRAVGDDGRVISVEADPRNFSALQFNVERLGLTNVELINAAVWSTNGKLSFAAEGSLGSAVVASGPRETNAVEVNAVTLDEIAQSHNLQKVDAVKMDIEGGEYEVLGSSKSFFERFRPSIMVEVHNDQSGAVNFPTVTKFFEDLGYTSQRDIGTLLFCKP